MLRAQPGTRARRIGVLMGTAATEQGQSYFAAFVQRLVELGWSKDRNTNIDVRWWTGEPEQMRPAIAELLALSPDVVMVFSNLALAVLKPMAGNVPIVFVGVGDPVGDGFVASLARPDGNITGFAGNHGPMGGKWLEVLKETAPHLTRIQAIYHPETPVHQAFWHSIREAAPRLGGPAPRRHLGHRESLDRAGLAIPIACGFRHRQLGHGRRARLLRSGLRVQFPPDRRICRSYPAR
jgi:putative ABC transport system substrate-binding protein